MEEIIAAQAESEKSVHDFLFTPSEELLCAVSDVRETVCKFLCLFNPDPALDALRESFLMQLCRGESLYTLAASVSEDSIENMWTSSLPSERVQTLLTFVTDQVNAFENIHVGLAANDDINELAWPCLVESMCCNNYWLSIDELLCLCVVAGQNVVICKQQGQHLVYAGSVLPCPRMPVILPTSCPQ